MAKTIDYKKKSIPLALTTGDLVQKNGDLLGLWSTTLDFDASATPFHGLFWKGMRYLSRFVFLIDGTPPLSLSSAASSHEENRQSPYFRHLRLLGPPISEFIEGCPPPNLLIDGPLLVDRKRFCYPSGIVDEITVYNHGPYVIQVPVSFMISTDLRDIMDIRGIREEWPAHSIHTTFEGNEGVLTFYFMGPDQTARETKITLEPHFLSWNAGSLEGSIEVSAHGKKTIKFKVHCKESVNRRIGAASDSKKGRIKSVASYLKQDLEDQKTFQSMWPTIEGDGLPLSRWRDNAINDLRILLTPTPFGPFPYAGIPWFSTPFGRDALISGFSTLWAHPPLTRAVLLFLSATQAKTEDRFRDAERGKILHEFRYGEAGKDPAVPFGHYYGSVDAPPLFIALAWEYLKRTGDKATLTKIRKSIVLAMEWIENRGVDPSSGFLVYKSDSGKGLIQKGWKDSGDSVFHANGELAKGPIALSEVQGYLYMAYLGFSNLLKFFGDAHLGTYFEEKAFKLRERFHQGFWSDKIHMFSLAIDGQGTPCEVRSSNAGHLLFTGIAYDQYAKKTAQELLMPDMFSGWGIRTLGAKEVRYNPVSYHNGSVWPHDNGLILAGFSKYGLKEELSLLAQSYFEALSSLPSERPPELFCGFEKSAVSEGPLSYPTSCRIQAWSIASFFLVIQALASLDLNTTDKKIIKINESEFRFIGSLKIDHIPA